MPQEAWRDLIQYLMTLKGIKRKSQLATALNVCDRTVRRWLGEKPAVPEEESLEKVARWAGMRCSSTWRRFRANIGDQR